MIRRGINNLHFTTWLLSTIGCPILLQDYTQPDFASELYKAGPFDLILDVSGGPNDATYLPHLKKNCGSKYVSTSSPLLKTMDKKGILVLNLIFSIKYY